MRVRRGVAAPRRGQAVRHGFCRRGSERASRAATSDEHVVGQASTGGIVDGSEVLRGYRRAPRCAPTWGRGGAALVDGTPLAHVDGSNARRSTGVTVEAQKFHLDTRRGLTSWHV